ncbi:MAG: MBG domain-containing protein [Bacteroidota bacterium]
MSALLVGVSNSFGQWTATKLPIPEQVTIYDIDFETEDKGWAVGTEGYILFYDGDSWEVHDVLTGNNFNRIHFTAENEGWAVTTEGHIFKYDGNQWNLDFSTTGGIRLFTLHFVESDVGFVSGESGYMAYYNGTQWVEGNIGFNESTLTSHFFDDKNGWLSAGAGQLFQLEDSVWTSVTISDAGAFNEMTFINESNGYGTGFSRDIWKYDGSAWNVEYTGINGQFTSLFFLDENYGWAGGNGYISTYCHGVWTEETINTDWIFDIHFISTDKGWAMGKNGDLLTYESPFAPLAWKPVGISASNLQITTLSSTTNAIYAAGNSPSFSDGIVKLFTSQDGVSWSEINTGFENYAIFYHLHAFDDGLLASLADDNVIPTLLKSVDVGKTWQPSQNGMVTNATILYIVSDNNGALYASTFNLVDNKYIPRLYKSNNQAASWVELTLTGIPDSDDALFFALSYMSSGFIMVYFNYENLSYDLLSSSDGLNWSKVANKPTGFLPQDVTIDKDGIWYLSGINRSTFLGELYASRNQGLSWKPIPTKGINEYNESFTAIESFNNELFLSGSLESQESKVFTSGVNKQNQVISFEPLPDVEYGNSDLLLNASSSSGLTVSYESSNPEVANISDNTLIVLQAGMSQIIARQEGNDQFFPAPSEAQQLNVTKAMLTVMVEDTERRFGAPNPDFELNYDGFVNNDDITVIDVLPTASTSADAGSPPSTYDITIDGGQDNNYSFKYVSGTLTVLEEPVTSTHKSITDALKVFPNPTKNSVYLQHSGNVRAIELFDLLGNRLFINKAIGKTVINLDIYDPGIYLLKISLRDSVQTFRIVRQ